MAQQGSVLQCPDPVDALFIQFKIAQRFRIFNPNETPCPSFCNVIEVARNLGLIFVGTPQGFKVLKTKLLSKCNNVEEYPQKQIVLGHRPTHIKINCDQSLLAVAVFSQGAGAQAIIYGVASFASKDPTVVQTVRLPPSPQFETRGLAWNPGVENLLSCCLTDGSFGVVVFKPSSYETNHLPATVQATCFCWSPKGKQVVIGSDNGTLTQYKPELAAVKTLPAPTTFGNNASVVNVVWISNFQFAAAYRNKANPDDPPVVMVVNANKNQPVVFVNYEDVAFTSSVFRQHEFYLLHLPVWNMLLVSASNSIELGVMQTKEDGVTWQQLRQIDSARADLPLNASGEETFPLGLAVDTTNDAMYPWGDTQLPPPPVLLVLSHEGILYMFHILNLLPNAPAICAPPDKHVDDSLFPLSSVAVEKTVAEVRPAVQPTAAVPPVQPAVAVPPVQPTAALPPVQPTAAVPPVQPMVPSFQQPTPSLFSSMASSGTSGFFSTKSSSLLPDPTSASDNKVTSLSGRDTVPASRTSTFQAPAPTPSKQPTPPVSVPTFSKPLNFSTSTMTTAAAAPQQQPAAAAASTTTASSPTVISSPSASPGLQTPEPVVDESVYIAAIQDEVDHFSSELKTLLHRCKSLNITVGTQKEKEYLRVKLEGLNEFWAELKETTSSLSVEVDTLKADLMETFSWLEEAKSRNRQRKNPNMVQLRRYEQLDPVSETNMKEVSQLRYYLESQLKQLNNHLDKEWTLHQDTCREDVKNKIVVPQVENVYKTMHVLLKIVNKQKVVVEELKKTMDRVYKIKAGTELQNRSQAVVKSSARASELSKLADSLLQIKISPKDNSAAGVTNSWATLTKARVDAITARNKRLTAEIESRLRDALSERPVVKVRPVKLNTSSSAFIRTSLLEHQQQQQQLPKLRPAPLSKEPEKEVVNLKTAFAFSNVSPEPTAAGKVTAIKNEGFPFSASADSKLFNFNATAKTPSAFTSAATQLTAPTSAPVVSSPSQATSATSKPSSAFSFGSSTPSSFSFTPLTTSSFGSSTNSFSFVGQATKADNFGSSPLDLAAKDLTKTPVSKSGFAPANLFPTTAGEAGKITPSAVAATSTTAASTPSSSILGQTKPVQGSVLSSTMPQQSVQASTVSSPFGQGSQLAAILSSPTVASPSILVPATTSTTNVFGEATLGAAVPKTSLFGQTTTVTPSSTASIFGQPAAGAGTSSIFGQTTTTTASTSTTSVTTKGIFGVSGTTSLPNIFGQTTSTVTSPTSSVFKETIGATISVLGQPANMPASASNIFGQSATTATTSSASASIFGQTPATANISAAILSSQNIFGQSSGTSANTSSAPSIFGQTAVNISATSSSPSIFGQSAGTATTTTAAAATPTSASIFGQSAGPATTTATTSTSTSIFDQSAGTVTSSAATSTSANIFGQSVGTATSTAATSPSTSIFGQSAGSVTTTATTLTSTSIFGQSAGTATTTVDSSTSASIFGQTAGTATTLAPSIFGQAASTPASSAATSSSSSIFGTVTTSATPTSPVIFGQASSTAVTSATTPSSPSVFGQVASTTTTASASSSSSIFGQAVGPASTSSSPSIFGQTGGTAISTTSSISPNIFGQAAGTASTSAITSSTSANIFGQSAATTATTSSASSNIFGQMLGAVTTASSIFGQTTSTNVFGQANTFAQKPDSLNQTTNLFGQLLSGEGGGMFGSSGSAPAATSASNIFTQSKPVFEQDSSSMFGAKPAISSSLFPASTTPSVFGQAGTSVFGSTQSSATTSVFGTAPTTSSSSFFGQNVCSPFGATSTVGPNQNPFGTSTFGSKQSFGQSVFGQGQESTFSGTSGGSVFGGASTSPASTNIFSSAGGSSFGASPSAGTFSGGQSSVAQAGFGSPPAYQKTSGFGSAPTFGSPAAASQTGGFGGSPSFAAPAFGSPSAFGSPQKVFGSPGGFTQAPAQSSTFENLANQNTVGFGNLAQQQQQPTAPTGFTGFSPPPAFGNNAGFGGNSFSSWR